MPPQLNVLVVGNSRFLRGAASSMLTSQGLKVFSANDGDQALVLAAQHRPDIVLLDSMLPEVHWGKVLQQIRQNKDTAEVPVIILGGFTHKNQNYLGYGPVDFVGKDSTVLDELSFRIRNYLRQKPS